jgi:hypothetical protein
MAPGNRAVEQQGGSSGDEPVRVDRRPHIGGGYEQLHPGASAWQCCRALSGPATQRQLKKHDRTDGSSSESWCTTWTVCVEPRSGIGASGGSGLQTSRPTLSSASGGRQKVDKQLQVVSSRESPYARALRPKTGNRRISRSALVRRVMVPARASSAVTAMA